MTSPRDTECENEKRSDDEQPNRRPPTGGASAGMGGWRRDGGENIHMHSLANPAIGGGDRRALSTSSGGDGDNVHRDGAALANPQRRAREDDGRAA